VAKDPARQDGWRFLTGETDIVEWDGVWEGPDKCVYFLETKYFVDGVSPQYLFHPWLGLILI
jgi:hypothetical protein